MPLAELGVTCLWLMPFYPTDDRDDGYDIIETVAAQDWVSQRLDHDFLLRLGGPQVGAIL